MTDSLFKLIDYLVPKRGLIKADPVTALVLVGIGIGVGYASRGMLNASEIAGKDQQIAILHERIATLSAAPASPPSAPATSPSPTTSNLANKVPMPDWDPPCQISQSTGIQVGNVGKNAGFSNVKIIGFARGLAAGNLLPGSTMSHLEVDSGCR